MDLTIKAKLVAKKSGIFTLLVFEDLTSGKFIMCTVLNNWDVGYIPINSEGYLTYEEAKAGETYYRAKTEEKSQYKYSQTYFKQFVPNNKETIL